MTFAARGLVVSLAFFAVLYSIMSLLAILAWRVLQRLGRKFSWSSPNFLFGLRLFPFAASLVVTVFFTFPSFWLMERVSPDEDFETYVLGLCALLIIGAGLFRVVRAQARTVRAVNRWSAKDDCSSPPLLLVGVLKPRVMISDTAMAVLSESELEVAVRHERAHMHSWDNLKRVLVSATPFPGMNSLQHAWQEAAELAADDRAVANRHEALDLAAALIKLSRSPGGQIDPMLATALVSGSSSVSVRVERLLSWRTGTRRSSRAWPWMLPVALTVTLAITTNYGATLALTHRLTELLVP